MKYCTESAAYRLMLFYPFWCELYYSLKLIEDYTIRTLQTDGVRLWVNPDYFNGLSLEYRITALAHEVCHKLLFHCTRGLDFDPYWGNIAADIIVNTLLFKNGFKIHPSWVQPDMQYDGWTFEAVYADLMKKLKASPPPPPQPGQGKPQQGGGNGQQQPQPQQGQGQGKPGKGGKGQDKGKPGKGAGDKPDKNVPENIEGNGPPTMPKWAPEQWKDINRDVQKFKGTPEARERLEQKIEVEVANAIANARAAGNAPAGIVGAVDQLREVKKESWHDHTARFMQALTMSEYNWARFDRRAMDQYDMIAPDSYAPTLECLVLLVDASGSCFAAAQQANFAGYMNDILSETRPKRIVVMTFDTKVHLTYEVDPGSFEMQPPKGGGGTSFIEPLQRAQEERPSVIICLTDLEGSFPNDPPECPILWASTTPLVAPFGETVHVQ